MLYGITPWHIRVLCDNPFEGGHGYTPEQAGACTIDEVMMLLADRKLLAGKRSKSVSLLSRNELPQDEDGLVPGVLSDGTAVRAKVKGVSKARQLMIESAKRKAEEKAKQQEKHNKHRRRRRG